MAKDRNEWSFGGDLETELKQLLRQIEDEPISDELRMLARKLQDALQHRGRLHQENGEGAEQNAG